MYGYDLREIRKTDRAGQAKLQEFLQREGIDKDGNLDYTVGLFDENGALAATGSAFMNTLRCLAVSNDYRGEGLMNTVVTHLLQYQLEQGNSHVFLYTKCDKAHIFAGLGFFEIARVENRVVFMENKRSGFGNYVTSQAAGEGVQGAIIMNANPFTKGHLYLVEQAASLCDTLHLFTVSEDISLVPFAVRKQLIRESTAHIPNIIHHDTGSYMISSATFPSYFLRDSDLVSRAHARLDMEIFVKIAKSMGITKRFVGSEKASAVTAIYNETMAEVLPQNGIELIEVPRLELENSVISASTVRMAIKNDDFDALHKLVPQPVYDFFTSEKAAKVIEKIKSSENIIHH